MNVIRLDERRSSLDKVRSLLSDGYLNLAISDLLGILIEQDVKTRIPQASTISLGYCP